MTKRIAEKTIATVTRMNTDWPVVAMVERENYGGYVLWVVRTVCNGIAEYSERFATKRDAMAQYEAL